jgi:hypothetical protein
MSLWHPHHRGPCLHHTCWRRVYVHIALSAAIVALIMLCPLSLLWGVVLMVVAHEAVDHWLDTLPKEP